MFPSSPRSASHSVMAQQGGYFGYYAQQPSHQYQTSEFNCNFQPIVPPSQMGDGFQGSWYNTPMYMTPTHPPHPSAMYQQRATGYEDWGIGSSIHHGLSSGAGSPSSLHTLPPSSSTSSSNSTLHSSISVVKPPLTPSPCTLPNGSSGGQSSPSYYPSYCKVSSDFGESEGAHSMTDAVDVAMSEVSLESHKSPPQGIRPQQARSPYEWMKKSYQTSNGNSAEESTFVDIDNMAVKGSQEDEAEMRESSWKIAGKTRTKDKYRVVYSDHQRLELEKEFHYSRYITIRRKSELASMLGLSERQVKIWFQNRRAKERKQMKKRDEIVQKDKMENGMSFHHGATIHQLAHHHQPPGPHPGHPPPLHPHPHPHPHLNQHHSVPSKPPPLMDVKPNLCMD